MSPRPWLARVWLCIGLGAALLGVVLPIGMAAWLRRDGLDATSVASDPARVALLTVAWCVGSGIVISLVGWGLARSCPPRGVLGWTAWIVPLLCPAYACWYALWHLASPGWAMGQWLALHGWVGLWRSGALAASLVLTLWPLAGLVVLGLRTPSGSADAAALDAPARVQRLRLAWEEDRRGVMVALVAIAGLTMADTTAFDVAQVRTIGFELRTLEAAGASPWTVLCASAWSLVAAVAVGILVTRPPPAVEDAPAPRSTSNRWLACGLLVLLLTPLLVLTVEGVREGVWPRMIAGYAGGIARTATAAVVCSIFCAGVSVLHAALAAGQSGARQIERSLRVAWIALALCPAVLVAALHLALWNRPGCSWVHDGIGIVAVAELTRWGWIGAMLGWLSMRSAPSDLRSCARVDGGAWTSVLALWPRVAAASIAAGMLCSLAAAGEVAVASRVQPPGGDWVASALLNAMHYQRPDIVGAFVPALLGVAVVVAFLVARTMRRHGVLALALLVAAVGGTACSETESGDVEPSWCEGAVVVGRGGTGPLQFNYPRAMAWTPEGELLIVDRSGRVQVLGPDGAYRREWRMPECDQGFPTGISVAPDGEVWVADTHEHRITVFDRDGRVLRVFGEFGQAPGQFVFPTDIAFADDGLVYVSEYGGNDRIQVFRRDGSFVRSFGRHGVPGDGQTEPVFDRPQCVLSLGGDRLLVADACNHRLVEVTTNGEFIRALGSIGQAAGEFLYPYGIERIGDDAVLVTEFGGCRLQAIDLRDGRTLGCWGSGGRSRGELNGPWTSQVHGDLLAVLDSTNHRVYLLPAKPWRTAGSPEAVAVPSP